MELEVIDCDSCHGRVQREDLVLLRLRKPDGQIRILDLHSACCERALGVLFNGAAPPNEGRTMKRQLEYFREQLRRRADKAEHAIEEFEHGAPVEVLLVTLRDEISEARQ